MWPFIKVTLAIFYNFAFLSELLILNTEFQLSPDLYMKNNFFKGLRSEKVSILSEILGRTTVTALTIQYLQRDSSGPSLPKVGN